MLLKRDPDVNFVQLILDLRRAPYRLTYGAIADRIGEDRSTVKGWFYHAHEPKFHAGRALIALHESLIGNQISDKTVIQSPSRAHDADQQERSMGQRRPKNVKTPGDDPQAGAAIPGQEAGASNVNAAIAAGASGRTHKVEKARAPVAPAKLPKILDETRGKEAPVNSKREMSYAEAMRQHEAGTLERSVLTEQGWVFPKAREIPKGAKV